MTDLLFFTASKFDLGGYAAFPSSKNPRIIVPLKSYSLFKAGLEVQNTASKKNRFIKQLLPFLYPVFKLFGLNKLSGSKKLDGLFETLKDRGYCPLQCDASALVGTKDSENRKITFLLFNANGGVQGILKYPLATGSGYYIENEYNSLNVLKNTPFCHIEIPRTFQLAPFNNAQALFQEHIFSETEELSNSLDNTILNASVELAQATKQEHCDEYLNSLLAGIVNINLDIAIVAAIQNAVLALKKACFPVVRMHGDFVLYNMRKRDDKLILIDWEYSRIGLPLFDIFHFIFQGKYQIDKLEVSACLLEAFKESNIDFYKAYLIKLNTEIDNLNNLFLIYLINEIIFSLKIQPNQKICDNHFYTAVQAMIMFSRSKIL